MNGWGSVFLAHRSRRRGAASRHAARELPGFVFPNVREHSIAEIWNGSDAFNRYRGFAWMKEPCRTCPERFKDFGGCRCQAWLLSGERRQRRSGLRQVSAPWRGAGGGGGSRRPRPP